ncbi:ribonuclease P protein component [bacterium]|nr:ribonuclease P protein component [bacterium]
MGLVRKFRLGKHSRFSLIYREGVRTDSYLFTLYHHVPVDRTEGTRFGFAVTKKLGGAVIRNKIRRRLQEAVRTLEPEIRGPLDLIVVAKGRIKAVSFVEIVISLRRCLQQKKLLQTTHEDVQG